MVDGMSVWETCSETVLVNDNKSPLRAENTQFYQDTLSFHLRKKVCKLFLLKLTIYLNKKENQKKHSPVPVSVIILSGIPAAPKRSLCSDIDYLGLLSALRKPNLCNRDDRLKKTTDRTKQNAQHESNRK